LTVGKRLDGGRCAFGRRKSHESTTPLQYESKQIEQTTNNKQTNKQSRKQHNNTPFGSIGIVDVSDASKRFECGLQLIATLQ
jgi:hypothetical protein